MLLTKLLSNIIKHRGLHEELFEIQARDTVDFLTSEEYVVQGSYLDDLGCGHGYIGGILHRDVGTHTLLLDHKDDRVGEFSDVCFRFIDLCDSRTYPTIIYPHFIVCSNVIEHLQVLDPILSYIKRNADMGGKCYLSWTNWLSPWGGHEYSPFHYLGPKAAEFIHSKVLRRKKQHTLGRNLFPTTIGHIKSLVEGYGLRVTRMFPRYYPELDWICYIPILREFFTWNCVMIIEK
jgi:hypothetical protein